MRELDTAEAGGPDHARQVSFAGAALEGPRPRPTQHPLRPARRRTGVGRDVLGEAATDEVLDAWAEAYGFLAQVLINREAQLYAEPVA